jgi:hypothetical protein
MKRFIALILAVSGSCIFIISCGSSEEPREEIIADSEDIVLADSLSGIESDIHQPDFICARHILISWDSTGSGGVLSSREEAQALAERIQADILAGNVTFEDMAYQHSECTTAQDSGMLPEFARGAMIEEFENAAFVLEPGEMSGIVETRFGLHLIKRIR